MQLQRFFLHFRRTFAERPSSKKASKRIQNEVKELAPVVEIKLPEIGQQLKNINISSSTTADPILLSDPEYPHWIWEARGPCRAALKSADFDDTDHDSLDQLNEVAKLKRYLRRSYYFVLLMSMMALVLGSGGHTSELVKIISNLPKNSTSNNCNNNKHVVIYSSGDSLSLLKYKSTFGVDPVIVKQIPRARRVGQSYLTSIFTTIYSWILSVLILAQLRPTPRIIICNGPAINVTISVAYYFISIASFNLVKRPKIIYIESVARSKSLSLTGKIMIYLADVFMIQWPELASKYKSRSNVLYSGFLV